MSIVRKIRKEKGEVIRKKEADSKKTCPSCSAPLVRNPDLNDVWWLEGVEKRLLYCSRGHGCWLSDKVLTDISVRLMYGETGDP